MNSPIRLHRWRKRAATLRFLWHIGWRLHSAEERSKWPRVLEELAQEKFRELEYRLGQKSKTCYQFHGGGNRQAPQGSRPHSPTLLPPSDLAERSPSETRKE